ncbi:MAG: TFIIB-type zinc ribbon-containing protein [Oscillospiraceae bacterium]|nr:TFIIB-type zinc ribbon-containing protein [Oscillospiraceae bacterium]
MESALTYKCPSCGGELVFDPGSQRFSCGYCGSSFTEIELRERTGGENRTDHADAPQKAPGEEEAAVFICPSCGAEIVTEKTTAATYCFYCHNPVVLSGRLEGNFRPEKVIPFRITRDEAVEKFLAWIKKKRFVPKAFFSDAQLEKITGVYYPYWMMDCTAETAAEATAQKVKIWRTGNTEHTQTSFYRIVREGKIRYKDLLKNALTKANRELAEGIQPFDTRVVEDFSMAYLSGFQAEKRDIDEEAALEEARREIDGYTRDLLRGTMTGYTSVQFQNLQTYLKEKEARYLLLPVWALTYQKKGKTYYYVMNGQNGNVCGRLPVSWKRLSVLFGSVTAVLFLLLALGGYLL